MITAAETRKKSKEKYANREVHQIILINKMIYDAMDKGEFGITICDFLGNNVIKELEDNGYEVVKNFHRNEYEYSIFW